MTRIAVTMPRVAPDADTCTIARWLKQVGDRVERGEPVLEVDTDKATLEVEARASGVLVDILHQPGENVAVGASIGYIEADE